MKIMLDTNVLVSTIFFPNTQTSIFLDKLFADARNEIVLCDYVIEELRTVVLRKFPAQRDAIDIFFYELPFTLVPTHVPSKDTPSMRDSYDEPILATALAENVDVLVTGDKDFHALNITKPLICTIADFCEL